MSMSAQLVCFIVVVAVQQIKLTTANNFTQSISVSHNAHRLFWLPPPTRFFQVGNAKLCAKLERLLFGTGGEEEEGEAHVRHGQVHRRLKHFNLKAYVEKTQMFLRSMRSWRLTRVFYATNSPNAVLWQWYDALHKLLSNTERLYDRYYFYHYLKNNDDGGISSCVKKLRLGRGVVDHFINDTNSTGDTILHGLLAYEDSPIDIFTRCNRSESAQLLQIIVRITEEYTKIQTIFTQLQEGLYGNYLNRDSAMRPLHAMLLAYKAMSSLVWGAEFHQQINSATNSLAKCGVQHDTLRDTTRMMARIALGRLGVVLLNANVSLGQAFKGTANLMKNVSCLILSEDVDIELSKHMSVKEIDKIKSMLQKDCAEIAQSLSCTTQFMQKVKELWSRSRISINQQFSAYSQYYNRMESILSIRWSLRLLLPFLASLGIPFNVLLLLYHCKRTNYKLPHNMLVMVLSIFDIVVLLVTLVCLFMDRFMEFDSNLKPTIYSDLWCKVAPFLQYFAIECAAWTLVLISLERCSLILNVLKSRQSKLLDYRKILVMLLSVLLGLVLINFTLMIVDEVTGPVRSTQGHHCVHYVRLKGASNNITYLTVIRPWIIALVRFVCPFCGLLCFNFITCRYLFCKNHFLTNFSFSNRDDAIFENYDNSSPSADSSPLGTVFKRELRISFRLAFVAVAYILISCPAPIVYFLYMIKHGDLIRLQIDNGLVALDDVNLREHWHLIGHFTAAMYITDYLLIPLCSSMNLFISCLVDYRLRAHLIDFIQRKPPRTFLAQNSDNGPSVVDTDNLDASHNGAMHDLQELQHSNLIESEYVVNGLSINAACFEEKNALKDVALDKSGEFARVNDEHPCVR